MPSSDPSDRSPFRKVAIPICLVLLSLALSVVLGEIVLRIHTPGNVYEWTRNVIQQEISIPSPLLGYITRPHSNIRFRNKEFDTNVITNSTSMRDQEYSYTNPEGWYRILVLGDSFAFGWGVEAKDSVAKILENELLRCVQVINMSVPGYNTLQELRLFQSEGIKYEPRLVMLFWFLNDIENNIPRLFFKNGRMFLEPPRSLYHKMHLFLMRNSYLYCALRLAVAAFRDSGSRPHHDVIPEGSDTDWQVEAELLRELKLETDKLGASLIIIHIPVKNHFVPQYRLGKIAETLDITMLDLGERFHSLSRSEQEKLYFKIDDHWTTYGHRRAAELIANYLELNGDIFAFKPHLCQTRSR